MTRRRRSAPERDEPSLPDLSRRQFLVRSAGLAGASIGIAVPSVRAAGGEELRVGLAGAGERGQQLLSALLDVPGVRVAAIADSATPARLRARDLARHRGGATGGGAPEVLLATGIERLLEHAERGKLDAIVIATPPEHHRAHAIGALAAGLHVYLEKPLGLDLAQCLDVRNAAVAAAARGQVFQIGLQRRYNPRYLAGIDAVRSGRAGRVGFVRAQWHHLGEPGPAKAWYYRRERSGDIVLEQGCHQMDVFNWIFDGVPASAGGSGGVGLREGEPPGRSIRDHYALDLEYPGGGKVHASHVSFAIPDRRFAGVYELVFGEKLGIDLVHGLAFDRAGKTVPLLQNERAGPRGGDTRLAVEAFARHVRQGERPAAGAEEGFLACAASILARTALDEGRRATWDELLRGAPPA